MFHAIANITQLAIMDNEPLFQVGYNERYNAGRNELHIFRYYNAIVFNSTLDHSQNYAFILHLVALHFICITFAFRIVPRIDIFALHFINISKCQINVK